MPISDKDLHIETEEMQRDGKDTYYNHKYEPTSYEVLEVLFKELQLSKDNGFVDYGCGMGRLIFYVHHLFHCRSVGVELNEEYYKDACNNLESYSKHTIHAKRDIHFHLQKAEEYEISKEDTIFYFFNPFSIEIFRKVVTKILRSMEEAFRKITIVLYYPDREYTYYLEEFTNFQCVARINADKNNKDEREGFLVYEL